MNFTPRTLAALAAIAAFAVAAPAAGAKRPAAAQPDTTQTSSADSTTGADDSTTGTDATGDAGNGDSTSGGDITQPPPPDPTACDAAPATSTVFSQFHDGKSYFLAPDGGFEAGAAGWTLDGSSVADGNETFNLGGASDAKSLSLPAGSSATSPDICIRRGHPQFRFVARTSGDWHARLKVEVLYKNGKGKPSRVAGKLRARDAWAPTKKLSLAIGRALGKGRHATGTVQLRFTPVGTGDWQIDDVYIDPHARG